MNLLRGDLRISEPVFSFCHSMVQFIAIQASEHSLFTFSSTESDG
jgi:hypothetical protein